MRPLALFLLSVLAADIAMANRTLLANLNVSSHSCTPMSDLTSIAFTQSMTQTRTRTGNVPTLQCVGNCPADAPLLLQAVCHREGVDDYGNPMWRCVPTFSQLYPNPTGKEYDLGQILVECEGCEETGDPNIQRGSCVLKYSITEKEADNATLLIEPSPSYGDRYALPESQEILSTVFWALVEFVGVFLCLTFVFNHCWSRSSSYTLGNGYNADAHGNVYDNPSLYVAPSHPDYHHSRLPAFGGAGLAGSACAGGSHERHPSDTAGSGWTDIEYLR